MPIYEYECESCGHRTELLQRVGAPPIGTCPECKGEMKRLVSAPAFQFKGTGWYVTDYAKKGRTAESASPPKSEGSGGDSATKTKDKGGKDSKSKAAT